MFRFVRSLALAGALMAVAAGPCAALAGGPGTCPMPGCGDESPFGSVASVCCCCEPFQAPADQGPGAAVAGKTVALQTAPAGADSTETTSSPCARADLDAADPSAVPLYVLHASLLR